MEAAAAAAAAATARAGAGHHAGDLVQSVHRLLQTAEASATSSSSIYHQPEGGIMSGNGVLEDTLSLFMVQVGRGDRGRGGGMEGGMEGGRERIRKGKERFGAGGSVSVMIRHLSAPLLYSLSYFRRSSLSA